MTNNCPSTCSSPLPADKLPQCWNEDSRMNVLYSPIRNKSVNPEDWKSKYEFWHKMITEWLRENMQCNFTINELKQVFKRKGSIPWCLSIVIDELHRNNLIVLENVFLQDGTDSWTSWTIDVFVKKPIIWSFSKLKNYVTGPTSDENTKYVHIEILKEIADFVYNTIAQNSDRQNILIPFSIVIQECKKKMSHKNITENTIFIALKWLQQNKRVIIHKDSDEIDSEILIKITSNSAQKITKVDETLYKLQIQENKLMKEIELMEDQKNDIVEKAKLSLKNGYKEIAKTHLRRKKELESNIQNRSKTLGNVISLASRIQDVDSTSSVLAAFKSSSDVLKEMRNNGPSEFDAQNVMDELAEILAEHKDVESTVTEIISHNETDSDLEKELEDLLNNDTPDQEDYNLEASELKSLEEELLNLNVKDLPSPIKSSPKLVSHSVKPKKLKSEFA